MSKFFHGATFPTEEAAREALPSGFQVVMTKNGGPEVTVYHEIRIFNGGQFSRHNGECLLAGARNWHKIKDQQVQIFLLTKSG